MDNELSDIALLTVLKTMSHYDSRILVLCQERESAFSETVKTLRFLFKNGTFDKISLTNDREILCPNKNRIWFFNIANLENELYARGIRGSLVIIDDSETLFKKSKLFTELVLPFLSTRRDPMLMQRLTYLYGKEIPSEWLEKPEIVFTNP